VLLAHHLVGGMALLPSRCRAARVKSRAIPASSIAAVSQLGGQPISIGAPCSAGLDTLPALATTVHREVGRGQATHHLCVTYAWHAFPPSCLPAGRGKCHDQFCHCEPPYFRWVPYKCTPTYTSGILSSVDSRALLAALMGMHHSPAPWCNPACLAASAARAARCTPPTIRAPAPSTSRSTCKEGCLALGDGKGA